jgi:hypothetical protein
VDEGEEGFLGGPPPPPPQAQQQSKAVVLPPQQPPQGFLPLTRAVPIKVVLMDEAAQRETTLPAVTVPKGTTLTVANVLRELLKGNPDALPPAGECMLCLQGPQGTDYRVLEAEQAGTTELTPEDTLFIARMAAPSSVTFAEGDPTSPGEL